MILQSEGGAVVTDEVSQEMLNTQANATQWEYRNIMNKQPINNNKVNNEQFITTLTGDHRARARGYSSTTRDLKQKGAQPSNTKGDGSTRELGLYGGAAQPKYHTGASSTSTREDLKCGRATYQRSSRGAERRINSRRGGERRINSSRGRYAPDEVVAKAGFDVMSVVCW